MSDITVTFTCQCGRTHRAALVLDGEAIAEAVDRHLFKKLERAAPPRLPEPPDIPPGNETKPS